MELIGGVEVHCMQFSVIAELVEVRHEVVFDVVVLELVEFAGYECEVDLGPFEVVQEYRHLFFVGEKEGEVFFSMKVGFEG